MKRLKKTLLWVVIILVTALVSAMGYVKFALPNVGEATDLKVEATPERIARGKYLANHITNCMDCHSTRDWSKFSGPLVEGTIGMGGQRFDHKFGFPGTYYSKNITPYGISRYTDGELFRVITTGVNKDGHAIFPIMPYKYYGRMDPEDIKSIIAYIRTLEPIKNEILNSESDFPMDFIINTIPEKASLTHIPDKTDIINYGKYLTNACACMECHTKFEKGALVAGTEYGGGREFTLPNGSIVRSKNISPDRQTGLGVWNEDMFVDLFIARSDSTNINRKLKPQEFNTLMPWSMYGTMKREDLAAIFAYLKTVKPIKNTVVPFSATPQL